MFTRQIKQKCEIEKKKIKNFQIFALQWFDALSMGTGFL